MTRGGSKDAPTSREDRLAQALRANLNRRKAQARQRKSELQQPAQGAPETTPQQLGTDAISAETTEQRGTTKNGAED